MIEQDISIVSGGVTLAGTFTTPNRDGRYPAALLLAGSGRLDRDGNHKRLPLALSRDLAGILNEEGWATLRFDKRGVGDSTGDYLSMGLYDELSNGLSALEWLQAHPQVIRTVPVGHSAGALYAAEMSARGLAPDGAVLFGYSIRTGEDTLIWQAGEIGQTVPQWIKRLMAVFRTSIEKQQAKALTKIRDTSENVVRIQGQKINAKWMREYLDYDPEPVLRKTTAPLLAITGSKDVQVNPVDIETVAEITGDHGTAMVIDDVDHLLRTETASISNPKRYKQQVAKPIDGRVVAALVAWLRGTSIGHQGETDVI